MKTFLLTSIAFVILTSGANADVVAQWNFNATNTFPTTAPLPSIGTGIASLLSPVTATFASGTATDGTPGPANSGWNTAGYPAQGVSNKTGGVQFSVSTAGKENIVVTWEQRISNTASRYGRLQYSIDGINFVESNAINMTTNNTFLAFTNSLSAVAAVNNNPDFKIRIVTEFESTATGAGLAQYVPTNQTAAAYSSAGTIRFDLVTISGDTIIGGNNPPGISGISNQTIRVTQSTNLAFTVSDVEDPAASLTLNGVSSNTNSVPNENIVFGGSGASRNVTVTAGNATGSSTITLFVIDTGGKSNSTSFVVTVLPSNTGPGISSVPHASTLVNTPTAAIPFVVNDAETPGTLTVTGASSNTDLLPNANIVVTGSDTNRTVTLTPASGQTGVAGITLTVSDGTNSATTRFSLVVVPSSNVIFNDFYNYPDGSIITNSGGLYTTRSGTVGQMQVVSGELLVSSDQTEDVNGPFIGQPYTPGSGTILYSSFKMKFTALPNQTPGLFAHFSAGNTLKGRIYAGTTNAALGSYRLSVANATAGHTQVTNELGLGTNYTVVSRLNVDSGATTLWINPSAESDASVSASDAVTPGSIQQYGFREDNDGGSAIMLVDDLRVGKSFADVVGVVPAQPSLNITKQGSDVILSWSDAAYGLQSSPLVTGNYTNISGATSPHTNAINGSEQYFRLRKP